MLGQRRARIIEHVISHHDRQRGNQLRLWVFGYDMDNMKARCWYESTLPLYGLQDCSKDALRQLETEIGQWLAGADLATFYLRTAVRDAWFDGDARGDFSAVDANFWNSTEAIFYRQLRDLIENARGEQESDILPVREAWLRTLTLVTIRLFDDVFVGSGPVERQKPHRIANAFNQLIRNMAGPKIRQALALPALTTKKPTSNKKTAKAALVQEAT